MSDLLHKQFIGLQIGTDYKMQHPYKRLQIDSEFRIGCNTQFSVSIYLRTSFPSAQPFTDALLKLCVATY